MVDAAQEDSDSDADHEEQRTRCLLSNDEVDKTSLKQVITMKILSEMKEVIDFQNERLELQRCEINDFKLEREKMLE